MTIGFSVNVSVGMWVDDLRADLKQSIKVIEPFKVEAIGIDALSPELNPRALSISGRRDLAQYIRARGTTLAALRADVGGRRLADPARLDVNLGRIREAIQLANDLAAPHLVVPAGFIPAETEKENASIRNAMSEAARALAGFAATSRTRVSWLGGTEAPEVLAQFLNSVDSSGILEVDLNPGGYVMRGVDPSKALNELSSRVGLARATDHYRGGAEAPFGKGDVRWGEILIGLSTLQRQSPLHVLAATTLEGDRLQGLSAAYKRLLALRKNPVA